MPDEKGVARSRTTTATRCRWCEQPISHFHRELCPWCSVLRQVAKSCSVLCLEHALQDKRDGKI